MIYNHAVIASSKQRKRKNIASFSGLSREGLEFGRVERMLLLHTTACGEKLYIQYPGKESKAANPAKIRPLDFRPRVARADGTFVRDLSFADIWDDISNMHNANPTALCHLAAVLAEMAFMNVHALVQEEYPYVDVNPEAGARVGKGMLPFEWYKPQFSAELLQQTEAAIGHNQGLSAEAYLFYNDLLAQNEDCKYFYRDEVLLHRTWSGYSGRRNTLLSHLSVIAYLQGHISFSEVMKRFQNGFGVAPCKIEELSVITAHLVYKA